MILSQKLLILFLLFSLCLPIRSYSQITVHHGTKARTIDSKYIIAIESKNLILHQYYKRKYSKQEKYLNIPSFDFIECKNIEVFSENLHILVEYYDSSTETRKDSMFVIPLADITAITATKNEARYGKSGVMHVLVLPLVTVGFFVASVVNFAIGEPQTAFSALGASAVSGLLFWWSVKSLQNEKKYIISTKKWDIRPN